MITQGENNVVLPLSLGVDLTGSTIEVVFKRGFYNFKKIATISDALKGLATVTFFSNDFRDWGKWKYQVSIIKGTDEVKLEQETLQVYQGVGEIIEPPDQTEPPPTEGSGLLTFATLAELQAAYPNGSTQPIWISGENAWYYWEGEVTEPTPDTTAPNEVTNLIATPSQTSVSLSWTTSTSSDVASYEVWRGSTLLTTVTGNSYNVTGLTVETLYNFTIKAKDSSGNISSGVSVSSTTLAEDVTPPADTTAPVLTITPAATFTDAQQITMTTNEAATIYYTLDGTTPTTSSSVYSTTLSLSVTTTVKAFAIDYSGNNSSIQTVLYTKQESGGTSKVEDGLTYFVENMTQSAEVSLDNPENYFNGSNDWTFVVTATMGRNARALRKWATLSATTNLDKTIDIYFTADDKYTTNIFTADSVGANLKVLSITSTNTFVASTRRQVVIRRTGNLIEMFVDNTLTGSIATTTLGTSNYMNKGTNPITVGHNITGSWGPVTIHNAGYYNRALTNEEITQNYNALK